MKVIRLALLSILPTFVAAGAVRAQADYQSEISELLNHPSIRRAFEVIDQLEPQTHQDLITLTEIPAPPFMEAERAAFYADLLRDAGADSVYIDEEGNVVAFRRGETGERTVAIDGHLDTVFPEGTDVTVRQSGDTLFAPGIGDDTRGLVVVLTVLRALEAADIRTDANILFIGSVGEEGLGDLRGVKHLFREGGPRIDSWIAVDGGGIDRIVNGGLGSHRYRVTFRGPGGHSWGAFGLANPMHAIGRAIAHFDANALPYVSEGPRTSYNVGRIGGGTSVNSVPFETWMEVDMRSVSPERLNGVDAIFQEAMQTALAEENAERTRGEELTLEVTLIGDRPSGEVAEGTPLVERAKATAMALGSEPRLTMSSTDSNIPISLGIPAVTIGRGGEGSGGHSLHEWWINRDGHIAIQNALTLLVAEAGLADVIP
ncbi:MAG: M20/M25/M40 family metallo-hydrolase [Gemmatimonadota bacterium]|nr:M20/M25/M40 family metallo-hydrolase [Gemmatimonadota bacterium]